MAHPLPDNLRVHTFHAAVNQGDSAVHLLVSPSGAQWTVHKAVLIDGGDNSKLETPLPTKTLGEGQSDRRANYLRIIDYINKNYLFALNAGFDDPTAPDTGIAADAYPPPLRVAQLRFDSVVITHWDEDHWKGVLELLEDGCRAYAVGNPVLKDLANNAAKTLLFQKAFLDQYYKAYPSPPNPARPADTSDAAIQLDYDAKVKLAKSRGIGFAKNGPLPPYETLVRDTWAVPGAQDIFDPINTYQDDIVVRCRYLKYSDDFNAEASMSPKLPSADNEMRRRDQKLAAIVAANKLRSTLYCPWPIENDDNNLPNRIGPEKITSKSGKYKFFLQCRYGSKYQFGAGHIADNILTGSQLRCDLPRGFDAFWTTAKESYVYPDVVAWMDVGPLARVAAHFEDYLGMEIFTHTPLPALWPRGDVVSPAHLIEAHTLVASHGPRMYIIAGDQTLIGDAPLGKADDPAIISDIAVAPDLPLHANAHRIQILAVDVNKTYYGTRLPDAQRKRTSFYVANQTKPLPGWNGVKNASSIVCVTIASTIRDWTGVATAKTLTPRAPLLERFKVLHLNGGDAVWDVEQGLARWFSGGYPNPPTRPLWGMGDWRPPANFFKLNHHGSYESCQKNLLEVLRPYIIVAPCGHGHPHPATPNLMLIDAQNTRRQREETFAKQQFVPPAKRSIEDVSIRDGKNILFCNYPLQMVEPSRGSVTYLEKEDPVIPWKSANAWKFASDTARFQRVIELYYGSDKDGNANPVNMLDDWNRQRTPGGDKIADAKNDNLKLVRTVLEKRWNALAAWDVSNKRVQGYLVEQFVDQTPNLSYSIISAAGVAVPMTPQFLHRITEHQEDAERTDKMEVEDPKTTAKEASLAESKPVADGSRKRTIEHEDTRQEKLLKTEEPINADEEAGYWGDNYLVGDRTLGLATRHGVERLATRRPVTGHLDTAPLSAPRTVPVAIASAVTDARPKIYIYGSRFGPIAPSSSACGLPPDVPGTFGFCSFLNMSRPGFFVADATPGPILRLLATDPWFQQIACGRGNVTEVRLAIPPGMPLGSPPAITGMEATITFGTVALNFSTANTFRVMHAETSVDPNTVASAFVGSYGILALGLNRTEQRLKLSEILGMFGPDWAVAFDKLPLPGFTHDIDPTFKVAGAPGSRNALTFLPFARSDHYLRLRFEPADELFATHLAGKLPFTLPLSFKPGSTALTIVAHHTVERHEGKDDLNPTNVRRSSSRAHTRVILETVVAIESNGKTLDVQLWLDFDQHRTQMVLRFASPDTDSTDPKSKWNGILGWLASQLHLDDGIPTDLGSYFAFDDRFAIELRQVEVVLRNPGGGDRFGLDRVTLRLEASILGAVFDVSLSVPQFTFKAQLWNAATNTDPDSAYRPWWESFETLHPIGSPDAMALREVAGSDPPQGFHAEVAEAEIDIMKLSGQSLSIFVSATLEASIPGPSDLPMPILGTLHVDGSWQAASGPTPAAWDINLGTEIMIFPRHYNPAVANQLLPAMLAFSASADNSGWQLSASAEGLNFASIYDFFHADAQEGVMDMLEHLSILKIQFLYDHPKKPGLHTLSAFGALQIGPLELDLAYTYRSSLDWSFQAQLGAFQNQGTSPVTIVSLLESFFPANDKPDLLLMLEDVPFVRDLAIPSVTTTPTGIADAPFQFSLSREGDLIIMWLQLEIITAAGTLHFLFVQATPKRAPPAASSTGKPPPSPPGPVPKRLLRVRLDHLPKIPSVPVVGQIDQPVQSVDYTLVVDQQGRLKSQTSGFTKKEIDAINITIAAVNPANTIQYRNTAPPSAGSSPPAAPQPADPYVLLSGHHFIASTGGKVLLDHAFGAAQPQLPGAGPRAATPPATTQDSGATFGQFRSASPPLTINNVGIQCKNDHVYIMLDAVVLLGPIELGLVGFGVGIPLSKISHLKDLTIDDFDIVLRGMGVSFIRPPIAIGGYFEHNPTPRYEEYLGGLMVAIPPYTLLAAGAYRHTFSPDFRSVMVFASLDGPLVSLEFAEISGVAVGFGYQYDLRLPDPAGVQNFPFVHGQQPQSSPLDLMSSSSLDPSAFHNWITATPKSLFFALGMKVDSFQVLSIDAALLVAFDGSSPKFGLVGIASASMPPTKSKGQRVFAYIEFGIVAALDIGGGSFVAGAQLTNNSYILDPSVHVVGGLAICYWFGPNAHAGDWVFTAGGYHPAYEVPAHYPRPPRIGVSWNLSDVLSISGTVFFAVTPKAAMGGGQLLAVFSAGPLYASFDAHASFLINFKPFFFIADIGICVTVGVHIDIGIIHIHLDGHISASLHLQGPPFGGVARFEFCSHGFDIYFGHQPDPPGPLPWSDFLALVQQPGPASESKALVVVALEDGAATDKMGPDTERKTGDTWVVRAGQLQFRVDCKFALDAMVMVMGQEHGVETYRAGRGGAPEKTTDDGGDLSTFQSQESLYARPMHHTETLLSVVSVTTTGPLNTNLQPWKIRPLVKALPHALWAQYDPREDPIHAGNNIQSLLSSDRGTVDHLTGFVFTKPRSSFPPDNIPPFNVMDAMSEDVYDDTVVHDDRPTLPSSAPSQTAELPAPRIADPAPHDNWDVAEKAWQAVQADNLSAMIQMAAAALSWNNDDVALLNSAPPSHLINHFEDYYVACPWMVTKAG